MAKEKKTEAPNEGFLKVHESEIFNAFKATLPVSPAFSPSIASLTFLPSNASSPFSSFKAFSFSAFLLQSLFSLLSPHGFLYWGENNDEYPAG